MNRIRSRLAPLAALMALLLALAGCSAAPSTEEPGTASQTKYATGKYTQTEVTPAVDSGFAPAKLQMLDGVPTLSLYNDAQNTAAAFSWTGDGWETIDPSTVQAFLDGLDKTQRQETERPGPRDGTLRLTERTLLVIIPNPLSLCYCWL